MSVKSIKNLTVYFRGVSSTSVDLVPTSITDANPPVVTVVDTTGATDGDVVVMTNTGITLLDGKAFLIQSLTGTTFELIRVDMSGNTDSLGGSPMATVWPQAGYVVVAAAELTIQPPSVNTIPIGTFTDPEATLPGTPTLGTVTVDGYMDTASTSYAQMIDMGNDGGNFAMKCEFPFSQGALVGELAFAGVTWNIPNASEGGAVGVQIQGTQAVSLSHAFA